MAPIQPSTIALEKRIAWVPAPETGVAQIGEVDGSGGCVWRVSYSVSFVDQVVFIYVKLCGVIADDHHLRITDRLVKYSYVHKLREEMKYAVTRPSANLTPMKPCRKSCTVLGTRI